MRVWWARNFSLTQAKPEYYHVNSIDEAKDLILKMSEEDNNNDRVIENAFGLEVFMNREWVEWTDEDCLDICEQF